MEKIAKDVSHEYSWCYVELPEYIKKKMLSFGKEIEKDDLFIEEADDGLELTPHITLKYALTTDKVKDVKNILRKEKGGKIKVCKSGIFESENYDVVKMDVESEDLQRLHSKINNLPHHDKYPEYKPHATLAYVKKGCGKKYDGKFVLDKSFRFKEVFFGNKDKRNYRIILASVKENLDNIFLRLSTFSKKLFLYSSVSGEYWIYDDGSTSYAGEGGDVNHDTYVIDYIRRKYCDDYKFDRGEYVDWEEFEESIIKEHQEDIVKSGKGEYEFLREYLQKELGMNSQEIDIARINIGRGEVDPKGYAVKELGWKKVNNDDVSTWTLTEEDMMAIKRGLSKVLESEDNYDDQTFNIYVESNNTVFYDVPFSVIERNITGELLEYRR